MTVFVKRNDSGDVIPFTCEDINGAAVNLTGALVRFNLGKKNKLITTGSAVITNAIQGKVQYTFTDADTLIAGNYPAEFEVTFPNGNRKTFPTIGYLMVQIEANLNNGKSTEVADQLAFKVSAIEQFKVDLATLQEQMKNFLQGGSQGATEVTDARLSAKNVAHPTLKARLDTFEKDFVANTYFAATAGTGAAYTTTLSPVPVGYTDGMVVSVKAHADALANATINVNGLGAKTLKRANGNNLTAGALKTNGIYTFRYNSTTGAFILQGDGGGGTAVASDLLSGKTASSDAGDITGTMPNNGAYDIIPSLVDQFIPAGYHSGLGKVKGGSVKKASGTGGTYSGNGTTVAFTDDWGTTQYLNWFKVSGLTFQPSFIVLMAGTDITIFDANATFNTKSKIIVTRGTVNYIQFMGNALVSSTGFTLPVNSSTLNQDLNTRWYAIE